MSSSLTHEAPRESHVQGRRDTGGRYADYHPAWLGKLSE
jgi:hypothetical protein